MKEGKMASGGVAVQFGFDNWDTGNYIFSPCHIYDGNRFRVLPIGYAPFIYDEKDRPLDMPITVTNIPHFNQDGSDATVDFRTNNCTTPLAGFYVLSGDFLLKLYRATGDLRYLELDKDMAHNIVQYVNTEGNRIQSEGGFGFVTERVQICDWESEGIGNIPQNDSNIAWENTTLHHTTENPGIYVQPDTGLLMVFDHVDARIVSRDADGVTLEITNPTYRDGDIRVLCETSDYARGHSLGWNAFYTWPKVHVAAGETVTVHVSDAPGKASGL
ncbi:MAG: hypothetical protein KBS80_07510 [Bacteroidales bacterium]|nr:hypothetical protein [Candidatus Cryptobacteroides choladohippi]